MNPLHNRLKLLPMSGPQDPISAAIASAATSLGASAAVATAIGSAAVTGLAVGAVGAAINGGNILKGALMGAVLGGITGGIGEAFSGTIEAANLAGAEATLNATESGLLSEAAWNAEGLANSAAIGQASPVTEAVSVTDALDGALPPANVNQAVSQTASTAPTSGVTPPKTPIPQSTGSGVGGQNTTTGIADKLKAGFTGLSDSKLANTGLLLGGQMLLGSKQQEAQDNEIKRRQSNMSWVAAPTRGAY
jgi:hypothetical protein